MKIHVEYTDSELNIDCLQIVAASFNSDFTIHLEFNDGHKSCVDFKPFLSKSLHPSIQKYRDIHNFAKFLLIDGNLNWNNYDMIFPIPDLYNGKVY